VDHPEYFLPYVGLWQGSYISRTVTLTNRQAAFHAAEENTEAVLAAQIEEITAHMSASVPDRGINYRPRPHCEAADSFPSGSAEFLYFQ
jgi:hypothetical protein